MTAQEFHKILKKNYYSYTYENNITTINNTGSVNLPSLTELPDNIVFNNNGYVDLYSLKALPNNITFNNKGFVDLYSLKELGNNITFNNKDNVYLYSLKHFNEDFKNLNKIIINEKKVYVIISKYNRLIDYLFDAYNIDYINKIKNRYYVYTK